ncbi:MAG: CYTH domain-containing protein [Acetivibrio ethanolgignens]
MEIEKKFKVIRLPENYKAYTKREIEQCYLCTSPVIRIRKSNEEYILTYKSKAGVGEGKTVRICNELEVPLTEESYLHLKEKADGMVIVKTRYLLPLSDGHRAELDVFHKAHEGLVIVEVEFGSEEEAGSFVPPEWFGEDVSCDNRYTNQWLAFHQDWR